MFTKWSTARSFEIPRGKFIFIALMMILFLTSCGLLPDERAEEEIPIITPPKLSERPEYAVTTGTIENKVRAVGKLMSMKEETVYFTLEGQNHRIKEIHVQSGDFVNAGQLIAELDVTELSNQLRTQELQFRTDELEMIRTLRAAHEMSSEALEQAKIAFEEKRVALIELREEIARAKLHAPISGTIVSLSKNSGDTVNAYDPVALIADMNQLTVAAKLNANDREKIAVGMEAVVDINAHGQHIGVVKRLPIASESNNQNPSYPPFNNGGGQDEDSIDNYMLVELESLPEGAARETPLSVSVITERKEDVIVIPPSTLRTYAGRTYVQVIEDDGTRREVDVEVGQQTSTQVEIIAGLEPGQKVVGR